MSIEQFEENVKQRAFELYCQKGETHGSDQEDWFQAEQEIRGRNSASKTGKRSGGKPRS